MTDPFFGLPEHPRTFGARGTALGIFNSLKSINNSGHESCNPTTEVVIGLAGALPQDAPLSMMHGAAPETLHKTPLSSILLLQQLSCQHVEGGEAYLRPIGRCSGLSRTLSVMRWSICWCMQLCYGIGFALYRVVACYSDAAPKQRSGCANPRHPMCIWKQ